MLEGLIGQAASFLLGEMKADGEDARELKKQMRDDPALAARVTAGRHAVHERTAVSTLKTDWLGRPKRYTWHEIQDDSGRTYRCVSAHDRSPVMVYGNVVNGDTRDMVESLEAEAYWNG